MKSPGLISSSAKIADAPLVAVPWMMWYTLESLPSNGGLALKFVGTKRPKSSMELISKVYEPIDLLSFFQIGQILMSYSQRQSKELLDCILEG